MMIAAAKTVNGALHATKRLQQRDDHKKKSRARKSPA
jgi:hypothetical protein